MKPNQTKQCYIIEDIHYANQNTKKITRSIRVMLVGFMTLLIVSGLTAFPLISEAEFLRDHIDIFPSYFHHWINVVVETILKTDPIMLYGTDWLAFAHIIIALFFIPVFISPVRYIHNMYVGMAACIFVFPLAFICGPIRTIPFFHQLIDCCFGVVGFIYLFIISKKIIKLKNQILCI
jgi:hypothetical protein